MIESFSSELQIAELDVPVPDADVELFWVEVADVHAQEAVEEVGYEALEHGGGGWPLSWPGMVLGVFGDIEGGDDC